MPYQEAIQRTISKSDLGKPARSSAPLGIGRPHLTSSDRASQLLLQPQKFFSWLIRQVCLQMFAAPAVHSLLHRCLWSNDDNQLEGYGGYIHTAYILQRAGVFWLSDNTCIFTGSSLRCFPDCTILPQNSHFFGGLLSFHI